MNELLLIAFSLGLLDSLNPSTIATQIVLLIRIRKPYASAWFIVGTYVTYFIGGIIIYFGVAAVLNEFLSSFTFSRNSAITIVELLVGVTLLLYGGYLLFKPKSKIQKEKSAPKYFTPITIFILSIGSTLSDLPTALPYFAFIGKLEQQAISIVEALLLFLVYVLLYVLPMLVLHFLFIRNQELVLAKSKPITAFIEMASKWILRMILISVGSYLIYDSIVNLI